MNVKLISITAPASHLNLTSAEELIAYTARISNPSNQHSVETAPKLLKYLIKHSHWSPFEMVSLTLEITTSRAIAQQILRHRSFSFQEFSQRYAAVTEFEQYQARRQDLKNRQNSVDDMSEADRSWFQAAQTEVISTGEALYTEALQRGIAKEQARFLLPLSTQTRLYMNGTVRSWIHYLELRCGNGTQLEHKEIAEAAKAIFSEQFPSIAEALEWKAL